MADEWATADTFDRTKLNRKTRFVGTGEQATAFITSPQIGQQVYSTESDATFTIDKLSTYNSSSAWVCPDIDAVDGDTGADNGGLGGNAVNVRYYKFFTLPTTEKFYVITQIDWFEDSASGNVFGGVDVVNVNPPTINSSLLAAVMPQYAAAGGAGAEINSPVYQSRILRGGTVCGAWLNSSTGSTFRRKTSGEGTNQSKNETYTSTPKLANTTTWNTSGSSLSYEVRMTVHYRGYN